MGMENVFLVEYQLAQHVSTCVGTECVPNNNSIIEEDSATHTRGEASVVDPTQHVLPPLNLPADDGRWLGVALAIVSLLQGVAQLLHSVNFTYRVSVAAQPKLAVACWE